MILGCLASCGNVLLRHSICLGHFCALKVRCKAAIAVQQALVPDVGKVDDENLKYAIKRLVRGVQSSRQCARQGFALALVHSAALFFVCKGEVCSYVAVIEQCRGCAGGACFTNKPNPWSNRKLFASMSVPIAFGDVGSIMCIT